ncbi:MAG: NAD-dependent deacylase [Dehalococcoidia bacterium]|nr:NAD-dependent deacylase [Dehalococcoidia bacterium]
MTDQIQELAQLVTESERTVVFTGAGVSTESGIPDFRSPGGIWSRYDPEDFTIQRFVSSPAARRAFWQMSSEGGLLADAEPNSAHYAIAELHRSGKLDCVITQNIDNLHQKAGVPDDRVFELHGNMQRVVCLGCRSRFPMPEMVQKFQVGLDIPDCPGCRGILKPDAVLFGEALPVVTLREATRRAQRCDLCIVIGSALVVYPAAYVPAYAREAGARLAIVNLTPTPLDHEAVVCIQGKAGEVMPRVLERVK